MESNGQKLDKKLTNAICIPFEYTEKIVQSIKIADEHAIGFAKFIINGNFAPHPKTPEYLPKLLEIYKSLNA